MATLRHVTNPCQEEHSTGSFSKEKPPPPTHTLHWALSCLKGQSVAVTAENSHDANGKNVKQHSRAEHKGPIASVCARGIKANFLPY